MGVIQRIRDGERFEYPEGRSEGIERPAAWQDREPSAME